MAAPWLVLDHRLEIVEDTAPARTDVARGPAEHAAEGSSNTRRVSIHANV